MVFKTIGWCFYRIVRSTVDWLFFYFCEKAFKQLVAHRVWRGFQAILLKMLQNKISNPTFTITWAHRHVLIHSQVYYLCTRLRRYPLTVMRQERKISAISPMQLYCLINLRFKSLWKATEPDSNFTQALQGISEAYTVLSHCQQEASLRRLKIWQSTAELRAHSKCILCLLQLQIEFQSTAWLKTPNNPMSLTVPQPNKVT